MLSAESVIERFLSSVGRADEARVYLETWRTGRPEAFALIDASAVTGEGARAALLADLHYLAALKLTPVIAGTDLSGPPISRVESADAAIECCRAGRIPTTRQTDLESLRSALNCGKVVLLGTAGLRGRSGDVISIVNTSERDRIVGELSDDDATLLSRACALVDASDGRTTVGITSAVDLLRELFTVRGAGTLVRRGSVIRAAAGLEREPMSALLADAFGRPIRPSFFDRDFVGALIADDHRGAAVLEAAPVGVYLSKFAVGTTARGEGVGRDLWHELSRRHQSLVWRARSGNPIADWYKQNADGFFRDGEWTAFWRGLRAAELERAIEFAVTKGDDFAPLAEP